MSWLKCHSNNWLDKSEDKKKQSKEKSKEKTNGKESKESKDEIKLLPKQWKIDGWFLVSFDTDKLDVCDWLKTINLGDDYTEQIKKAKIDGEVLVTMTTQVCCEHENILC